MTFYLVWDSPFSLPQWPVVVVHVPQIEAFAILDFFNFSHYWIKSNKGIIITLHDILRRNNTSLRSSNNNMKKWESRCIQTVRKCTPLCYIPHSHKWQQSSEQPDHSYPQKGQWQCPWRNLLLLSNLHSLPFCRSALKHVSVIYVPIYQDKNGGRQFFSRNQCNKKTCHYAWWISYQRHPRSPHGHTLSEMAPRWKNAYEQLNILFAKRRRF